MNGTNYTAAGLTAALTPILPAGATRDAERLRRRQHQRAEQPGLPGDASAGRWRRRTSRACSASANFTSGASGFVGETRQGRRGRQQGRSETPDGQRDPGGAGSGRATRSRCGRRSPSPARRPTPTATRCVYCWEQNDRGGARRHGAAEQHEGRRPAVRDVPGLGADRGRDTLLYNSPGENHLTTNPTRVFPDLQQILDNNTNADTGACPTGPIAPPVPIPVKECFAEFLPTSAYVGVRRATATRRSGRAVPEVPLHRA